MKLESRRKVISELVVTEIRMVGTVVRPASSTAEGGLVTMADGSAYVVAPALYRVVSTEQKHESALGLVPAGTPGISPEYVPSEDWPEEFFIDNAVHYSSADLARLRGK